MPKNQKETVHPNNIENSAAGVVEIVYYTDPLCCWSWGFEPQWRRLRYEFGAGIKWRYCMGGLIPSWKVFHDSVNAVSRPAQMGPVWMEAGHLTGMPNQNSIWMKEAPQSSYLACIAVKCAALQSPAAGDMYLRQLREAVMLQGRNIAVQSVLVQEAHSFAAPHPALFDAVLFERHLIEGAGKEAFNADLQEVQRMKINRFPTLIFRRAGKPSLLLSGYRPYVVLLDVMQQLAPELQRTPATSAEAYMQYWGSLTERELSEITENTGKVVAH
jgi:predicted DsbA family dithiol-disulfide isomerase